MTFWRDWLCWLRLVVAVGCFVVDTFPQWSEWVDPATGDKVSERLWFSPSYKYVHRDLAQGGFKKESGFEWLSNVIAGGPISVGSLDEGRHAYGETQATR
jgi:hypothetical protein